MLLSLLLVFQLNAQGVLLKGKVVESSGEPVIGAIVYYDGTDIRTVTDASGNFSISLKPGKILVFSCFGLKDERISVAAGQTGPITVKMKDDSYRLDDAVVIGYGSQQREDLTGSVASVKADEIRSANSLDVLGSLQGRVSGLNITSQSGEPGSGYSIKIRGNNSINAASTPLVVVDGMQMDIDVDEGATSSMSLSTSDPLAFLNPVDIQSVEVLKDASATAIYGSRGANGVILITTKSGAENAGKTAVTFDANYGITTLARDIEMLDGQEWINYRFERGDNDYKFFGKDIDGNGSLDVPKTLEDYKRNPVNWREKMLRDAFSQQYNVSLRSSIGKGTKLLMSTGYLDQQGLIVNNGYTKFTGKIKIDHNVSKSLTAGVNANFSRTKSTGAATSSGGSFTSYGITQLIYLEKPLERFSDPADPSSLFTAQTSIYDCITSETSRIGVANKLMGNAYLEWKIYKDLVFKAYASGSLSYATNDEFFSDKTRWGHFYNGVATVSSSSTTGVTANATLSYKHVWAKKHNFDAVLGSEINEYNFRSYSQTAENFVDDTLRENVLAMGTLLNPSQSRNSNARISAFGRVNYNYDWRYYLTFNMRSDASSKFAEGSRVGYFPSVSTAWRISNEPWMKSLKRKGLDNLKLRLSAGSSGNDRISNYAFLSTIDKTYYSDGTGRQLLAMADYSAGNKDLKWETTYQYDAGIDASLFKGRIDMVFDVYDKETMDMLFLATIPAQSGFAEQWRNIGHVSNKGLELSLSTVNVRKKGFTWSTNITFDLNRNKIVSLGEGINEKPNNINKGQFEEEPTKLMVGQPIGIIWGYEWDGNYQLDDFDIYYRNSSIKVSPDLVCSANYNDFDYKLKSDVVRMSSVDVYPGDRKLKDLDGDKVITEEGDKTIIGKCDPDFSYAFGNTFTYGPLTLYVFFDGVFGRDILNEFKYNIVPGGTIAYNNISRDAYYNAWRPESGSNKHARLANQMNTQRPLSSYYVEDGSYLRLKTMSLSYNLPSKLCKSMKIDGVKVSFSVSNVHVWTNYTGIDPDISSKNTTFPGLDRMGYPTGRTYSFGLIANF